MSRRHQPAASSPNIAAPGGNAAESPAISGLAELVQVLSAMAAAPLGARPKLDQEAIERINNSPLQPVLTELRPIYKKLGPLEGSPEHLQAQARAAQQTAAHSPDSQPGPASVHGPASGAGSAPGPGPATGGGPASGPGPATGGRPASGPGPATGAGPGPATGGRPASGPGPATGGGPASGPGPATGGGPASGPGPATGGGPASGPGPAAGIRRGPGPGPSSAQQPTPAAAPAAVGITNAQAGLISVTLKLNSVSQAVTDMKDSTKAAKTQIETLDQKVSLISGRLDPALADLTQQVKRLQDDLVDEFNAERTGLETKVKELEAEVEEREEEVKELGEEVKELKNEAKELQQVIRDTRAELLTVEAASKTALRGIFSDTPRSTDSRRGTGDAPVNLLQTAKQVRTNTLDLITKCHVLFSLIDRDSEMEPDISDLGMEGEWGRCAKHLRGFNSKLRGAVEEKEETAQKLQFVGWIIDQMRKGDGIPNFGLDFARLAARPSAAPPASSRSSTAPTGVATSQDYSSDGLAAEKIRTPSTRPNRHTIILALGMHFVGSVCKMRKRLGLKCVMLLE
ncbi:hypothetical protein FRC01_002257 [Tulasnella sp. 417]|nr:hypothetical protein FRC01_002257 [Tulasnella sp. 417]